MEKGGQRENGHKPDQYKPMLSHQWIPPPQSMKDHTAMKLMAVMAERDAAIQQRDAAVNEKKAALSERDIAIIHRDAAYAERNAAWMERDAAIAALEYARDNGMACPSVHVANSRVSGGKYIHSDAACHVRETQMANVYPMSVSDAVLNVKPGRVRAPRKERKVVTALKPTPRTRKPRRQGAGEQMNKQLPKHEWKDQGLGLNQVAFDDSTMPIPVCSCTGEFQQCYKWGNGGWQSACCTTTMSLYPLPVLPNKKHTRMGGRKMSGSAFGKLLNKLAAEGYDLSMPLDLKDHWAKHGTNRYITIK